MQQSVLKDFPDADISVSIVWIDMLPADNDKAASAAAQLFDDPRVRQFHDPRDSQRAGAAFAEGLLFKDAGPAWDVYLFYDKEAEWGDDVPPKPVEWVHQLSGKKRADPSRYVGGKVAQALHELMHKVTKAPCQER